MLWKLCMSGHINNHHSLTVTVLSCFVFMLFVVFLFVAGFAQEGRAMAVRPQVIDVDSTLEGREVKIEIQNTELEPHEYRAEIVVVSYDDHGVLSTIGEPVLEIPEQIIALDTGERREVLFTLSDIPNDRALAIKISQIQAETQQGIEVRSSTLVPIFAIDQENTVLMLRDATLRQRGLSRPVDLSFTYINDSSTTTLPSGAVVISSLLGSYSEAIAINPLAERILPNSEKTMRVRWDDNGFRFGIYTLELSTIHPLEPSVKTVWRVMIVPWELALFALISLLGLITHAVRKKAVFAVHRDRGHVDDRDS